MAIDKTDGGASLSHHRLLAILLITILAFHIKLGAKTGLLAASISAAAVPVLVPPSISLASPETIAIAPHDFAYRLAGDFNQDGRPMDAPLVAIGRNASLHIMKRQVTAMEYDRCVSDAKCSPIAPGEAKDTNLPVTRASWLDATAYASWLSAKTGETWRLPTDEEWAFAARSRFHDDALPVAAARDPSARWLARYERETEQAAFDQKPRPAGAFGPNEYGLLDMSGNVWEWTNTCFVRRTLDSAGEPAGDAIVNCGVRVAEGAHRAYVTDFVRDARAGGCAVGKPPANLGFRLVRDMKPR
jgi:formylglycine-generating enzyme required for sulfatase activity